MKNKNIIIPGEWLEEDLTGFENNEILSFAEEIKRMKTVGSV